MNGPIWPEIELVRDFMTVFVTCKLDEAPIKNEVDILRKTCSPLYVYGSFRQGTKGQVTPKLIVRPGRNMNSSEILCPSRLSASIMKIRLKLEGYIPDKVKYGVFRHPRASNSEVNIPIWPEFELVRDFMTVLVTCTFEDDSIKSDVASLGTTFTAL